MLDFNTKKEILKNLRAKRDGNRLFWLPCVIAELFVKLWYSAACSIDMALSDRNGNFLGIRHREKKKVRRKDDIVYTKKPFLGRVMSMVLAFSFVFMMVPELGMLTVFADDNGDGFWRFDELIPGQCVEDSNSYLFDLDQYNAAKAATATNLQVIYANESVQLSWEPPDGFQGNKRLKYYIGYSTSTVADVLINANYGGTTLILDEDDGLKYNENYEFYVIPLIKIPTYVDAQQKDVDGKLQFVYDENGNQLYSSSGEKTVEGTIATFLSDSPDKKIVPSVTLDSAEFDAASGEVVLKWQHTSKDTVNGNPPYGYVVYRAKMNGSTTSDDFEDVAYFPANQYLSTDGVTIEYRDGDGIQFGMVYQYYIKAYTNLFGGNSYKDDDEPGTITSGIGSKLSVFIPPAKVLSMEVESDGKNMLTVSWKKPSGSNVDGYFLYRSESSYTEGYLDTFLNADGTRKYWDDATNSYDYFRFIQDMVASGDAKELSPTGTEYEDKYSPNNKLDNDKLYYYYVIPYVDADKSGVRKLYGPMTSSSGSINATLGVPQWKGVSSSDGAVNLQWESVKGADGYRIYYKKVKNYDSTPSADTTIKTIDVGSVTKYTHDGLLNGEQYVYTIRAFINAASSEDPEKLFGNYSGEKTITVGVELDIPQDLKVTTKDGANSISWKMVTDAEGYVLYYKRNVDLVWNKVELEGTKFEHTGLNNGDTYEYYVVAFKTITQSYDPSGREQVVYSEPSITVSMMVGDGIDPPKDFSVETSDGVAELSWTRVPGAEGYVLYGFCSGKTSLEIDLGKTSYEHTGLENGDKWTYYVKAYKTVNGVRVFSDKTNSVTVTIGMSLNAPIDLIATAGNRQIDLTWTKVKDAEGYVVYLFDEDSMEFEPLTVTSKTQYSHIGLKNGVEYTYMVAAFKTVNGERHYGEYSMSVSAIPTTGSITDVDRNLNIKGTTPYGISHSEYISAMANHGAFDESVDIYFTTNKESTAAVKNVLRHYANGLSSFIIYPFDISVYKEGTLIEITPNDGYSVTVTMPIPDKLIAYRDYLTVVHINENAVENIQQTEWYEVSDQQLEVLPCAVLDIDNVWCVQFVCSSFSPYAFVIYKDHTDNVSSGVGVFGGTFAGDFNSGMLIASVVPDVMLNNRKLRVVVGGKKKYRIKKIEKH